MLGTRLLSLAIAASMGAVVVIVGHWLYQSVVPEFVSADRFAATIVVLFVLLVVAGIGSIRGRILDATAFVGGAGTVWAVASGRSVALCESGSLFRPCTQSELLTMMIPVAILAAAAYVLVVTVITRAAAPK